MNSLSYLDNGHEDTNRTWNNYRRRGQKETSLYLTSSTQIRTTDSINRDDFIALLSILFFTNDLHGAKVFPLSTTCQGIKLSICLTKKEIRELTLKVRHATQVRTLSEMGIRHTLRPDGSPVVLYSTLSDLMDNPKQKSNQPDFGSLGQ